MTDPTDKLNEPERRFVKEFMVDRDPGAAALRAGVAKINLKRTVQKWMGDVRILKAIQSATDSATIETMITPQRIVAGWMDIAFNSANPPAARNAALKELAAVSKMYEDPDDDRKKSGVMLVPVAGSLDEWAAMALEAQSKLTKEVRE